MDEKLKQIEQHITLCIRIGVLPSDYRQTEEYKELIRRMKYE